MRQRAERSKSGFGRAAKAVAAACLGAPLMLTGCHNFFVCQKASCPSTGTGTGTGTTGSGDYVYVSNATTGPTYLAGYDISNGALTALTDFPYSLGYVPVALSVAPSNKFLYVAARLDATNPGVYRYTIGSDGSLSNPTQPVTADLVSAMDTSPDGNYLFTVSTTGLSMNEYQVNTSTGALTLVGPISLPIGGSCALQPGTPVTQACSIKVSPSKQFVVVSLGTLGDVIFPYTSSSGITSSYVSVISPGSSISGDYSVALDQNNYAYIARTTSLAVFSIASNGAATQLSTASYDSGMVPRSVALSSGYGQVYTANEGASTISGYSISSGSLTAISGSPFSGPTDVSAIGVDSTGKYLVAAGFDGSSGVQLYSIGSSGVLSPVVGAGTGTATTSPALLALTH